MSAYLRLQTVLSAARALTVACDTGLLVLLVGPEPVPEPARRLGLDPTAVALLLDVLAANGLVTREPDGWWTPEWVRRSDAGIPIASQVRVLAGLDTFVREGTGVSREGLPHDARVVEGLARIMGDAPAALAASLAPAGTILDVGAGSAAWSLAMLAADPHARGIAVDRAPVLEAAHAHAERLGLADRLTCLPGSFWELALPTADRVVLASVLHLFDADTAARLVARTAAALAPDGELVIVDVVPPPGPLDPVLAGYAMTLRMRWPGGTVHRRGVFEALAARSALRLDRHVPLPAPAPAFGALVFRR